MPVIKKCMSSTSQLGSGLTLIKKEREREKEIEGERKR
jgi:hypothetical protein